jgi:trk system potassium uptake protein TrkA
MYVIVVGAGSLGSRLIGLLLEDGHDVVVIESDEKVAKEASDRFDAMVLQAHIAQEGILEEAGAEKADTMVATTDDDSANLMAMFLGVEKEVETLVSVVNGSHHRKLFERLGVHIFTDPEIIVARHLFNLVRDPRVEELFSVPKGAVAFRITLGESSPLAGKTPSEAREAGVLPEGLVLASVTRGEDTLIPSGETHLEAEDQLIVFSRAPLDKAHIKVFTG